MPREDNYIFSYIFSRSQRMRRTCAAVSILLLFLLLLLSVPATKAIASSGATLSASINGSPLSDSSESHPIRLYPLRPIEVSLTLDNRTSETIHVGNVRLTGQVMGLTFFAYNTTVAFDVAAGRSATTRYRLSLIGLTGQAVGLIEGSITVEDTNQRVLASQGLVVDVRGSLRSVYGLFGIAVLVLTILALLAVLVRLARHRLSLNRFHRALRFLVPGIGIGLVLVFTLSATRIFVPDPGHWIPLVLVSSAALFGLGYLTPDPRIDLEEEQQRVGEELIAARLAAAGLAHQPAHLGGSPSEFLAVSHGRSAEEAPGFPPIPEYLSQGPLDPIDPHQP